MESRKICARRFRLFDAAFHFGASGILAFFCEFEIVEEF